MCPNGRSIQHGNDFEITGLLHDLIPSGPIELTLLGFNLRPGESLPHKLEASGFDLIEVLGQLRISVLFERDVDAETLDRRRNRIRKTIRDAARLLLMIKRDGRCRADDDAQSDRTEDG